MYAGIHHPGIPYPLYTLGTPCTSTVLVWARCTTEVRIGVSERSPGLKEEETHGWEASSRLKGVNPVMVVRPVCAELLPLSRWERIEDWIDEGCFPVYGPMLGPSAQRGVPPSGHPIVLINEAKRVLRWCGRWGLMAVMPPMGRP